MCGPDGRAWSSGTDTKPQIAWGSWCWTPAVQAVGVYAGAASAGAPPAAVSSSPRQVAASVAARRGCRRRLCNPRAEHTRLPPTDPEASPRYDPGDVDPLAFGQGAATAQSV